MTRPPSVKGNAVPVGARLPMTAGSGAKVLLAYSDAATQQAVLPTAMFTDRTLAEVRKRGWAQSAAERVAPLVTWCRAHFPGMSTRQAVPWAGLRPMMPDMMPRVMQGKNPRVFYNTGHGHLGWTLSAATADAVAALATGRKNDQGLVR